MKCPTYQTHVGLLDELTGTLVLGFEEWDAAKWVRELDTGVESVNVFVTRDLKDVRVKAG